MFNKESEFEAALIKLLFEKGWENTVIKNPTEQELIRNWADILFENNRGVDRLNNAHLTDGEMQQIIEQINVLKTPLKLNGFINGKSVSIIRDNPADTLHFGKEISLKIYDRMEIAAGQSRYQIVQQPKFPTQSVMVSDRRGDLMLLINGMPVFHIELKKSGVPVSQAANQIEKYSKAGIFTGLFALVQIFVAINPEETVYFANPGTEGKFNPDYYFHWADFNNEPINDWKDIASSLLSIPMAHQLIGFYTVADRTDGVLKVMRSYQYYAANAVSDRVAKIKWGGNNLYGGYVWHTTGSGKTMTSFKSAQLIANSDHADKVVFLVDRIELGTQSLNEYRGFSDESETVQATEDGSVLKTRLKSTDPADTLIVTSIQKMSGIKDEDGLNAKDLEIMGAKRIVFIVDEAHRSTFGDMLITIKNTFPSAIFFGFTGTPIHDENQRKGNTTATVFGNELHRYSIADGIRDKNVLGFDPYKILTFKDRDVRKAVALHEAKANDEAEAINDEKKKKVYYKFINDVKMAGFFDADGKYVKGIEDYLPLNQYMGEEHRTQVVKDILDNWLTLSHNGKFHAIFATSSIPEAVEYYRMLKKAAPNIKVTALFDPNIGNSNPDGAGFKEEGLIEILEDYNKRYEQKFTIPNHAMFKKDIAARLAHKEPYLRIEKTPEKQLDLLIVVSQMLTGFDSKWINTLYMDKTMEYANIIQAFSRTNRLFGVDKPFGTIRYYRKPHTMERNIAEAVEAYSGNKVWGLFVDRLEDNLKNMNSVFDEIAEVFKNAGVSDFEKLPDDISARGKFASLFKIFNDYLEAAKIQGFKWEQEKYEFTSEESKESGAKTFVEMEFDESIYLILALRYKELFGSSGESGSIDDIPFEISGYLTEIDTGVIDSDYMNTRFDKYLKLLHADSSKEHIEHALNDLHKTFASLTQEEQKYAKLFLGDIQRGDVVVSDSKTLRDYITEYQAKTKHDQIHKFAITFSIDEEALRRLILLRVTEININENGRLTKLLDSADKTKAKEYFERLEGSKVPQFRINSRLDKLIRDFVIKGGFDI